MVVYIQRHTGTVDYEYALKEVDISGIVTLNSLRINLIPLSHCFKDGKPAVLCVGYAGPRPQPR